MAVLLAESLLDCDGINPADILNRYLAWWRDGAFDTGPVSGRAFAFMTAGKPVQDATGQVHREFGGKTAGCNPTHRSLRLSMLASLADADLAVCAMTEARLTHHDPLAGEVAAALNHLCQSLIRGVRWEDALPGVSPLRRAGRAEPQRRRCAGRASGSAAPRRHLRGLRRGGGQVAGLCWDFQLLLGRGCSAIRSSALSPTSIRQDCTRN
jgi:ADP-ribosylglycohydrolase